MTISSTPGYEPTGAEKDLQPYCEAVKQHFNAQHVILIVLREGHSMIGLATDDATEAVTELQTVANTVLGSASNGKLELLLRTPHGITPVPRAHNFNQWVSCLNDGKEGIQ